MERASFYLTCAPGLEFISAGELESKGLGEVIETRRGRGRVLFESKFERVPEMHCSMRTVERVVLLLYRGRAASLDDIYRSVKSLDFSFIKPDWSFAVRSIRVGEHGFTSVDVGRVAGQAVIDSYMEARGLRLKVNLDEPDVIVKCDLISEELLVGVDMTGDEGLHKRKYRVYQHPAPLNPTIAAALVYLSGWTHECSLLDPFCGSGTILFEAGMIAKNTPICKFRRDFAFLKFFEELPEIEERDVELKLYGVERFRKHLEGARRIADHVGIHPTFIQGYAERVNEYFDEVDCVITNPPYGFRIGKRATVEKLYSAFLESVSSILKRKMVVITKERELFRKYASRFFPKLIEYDARYGDLPVGIYLIEV
ncbi:MAG: tRNA (guanine(6)-N2)-methyltransferase [Candidatus Korarchaeum sp.]|nr:tRNA (guanine(6)-N2)-methyltransferase [Candidatus Korarchaeum sp.]MDW8035791.1 tRNA (guanine(6)-N2)-methyltransferase [Candidatus Korarchaeum sp.]